MDNERRRRLELADFLRSRRGRILPSQAGLPSGTRRRTRGLRREELAQLAGVGLTWYTWLEQGRPIRVSSQVLESLSRVLGLDRDERRHLYALAHGTAPLDGRSEGITEVPQSVRRIVDGLTLSPALLIDRRWNILTWNRSARLVFGDFEAAESSGRNMVRIMFANEAFRRLFVRWEAHARSTLARFRMTCGENSSDPWYADFVDELKKLSPEFAEWWADHDVELVGGMSKEMLHPSAGRLLFEFVGLDVSDIPGLRVIVNTPADEETIAKMKILTGADTAKI